MNTYKGFKLTDKGIAIGGFDADIIVQTLMSGFYDYTYCKSVEEAEKVVLSESSIIGDDIDSFTYDDNLYNEELLFCEASGFSKEKTAKHMNEWLEEQRKTMIEDAKASLGEFTIQELIDDDRGDIVKEFGYVEECEEE